MDYEVQKLFLQMMNNQRCGYVSNPLLNRLCKILTSLSLGLIATLMIRAEDCLGIKVCIKLGVKVDKKRLLPLNNESKIE